MNEWMDRRMDELVTTGLQQWTVTQQMVIISPLSTQQKYQFQKALICRCKLNRKSGIIVLRQVTNKSL